jgi:hypothetical protein
MTIQNLTRPFFLYTEYAASICQLWKGNSVQCSNNKKNTINYLPEIFQSNPQGKVLKWIRYRWNNSFLSTVVTELLLAKIPQPVRNLIHLLLHEHESSKLRVEKEGFNILSVNLLCFCSWYPQTSLNSIQFHETVKCQSNPGFLFTLYLLNKSLLYLRLTNPFAYTCTNRM